MIQRYKLEHRIGAGGMGVVYEASRIPREGTHEIVACKLMHRDLFARRSYLDLFYQEARLNLALSGDHPGLVTVHECLKNEDGIPYLVMELVDGCSLADVMAHHERIPTIGIRYIAARVLDTLAYIHSRSVVHRDISPCNVLIARDGTVKVSDLGLAVVATDGPLAVSRFRGKPVYSSPEGLRCGELDERSDLYSAGAVMYEMLTGEPPLGRDIDLHGIMACIRHWPTIRLSREHPRDLRALALGLLCEQPDDRRPQTAAEARDRVQAVDDVEARDVVGAMVSAVLETRDGPRGVDRSDVALYEGDIIEGPRAFDLADVALQDTVPELPDAEDDFEERVATDDVLYLPMARPARPAEPARRMRSPRPPARRLSRYAMMVAILPLVLALDARPVDDDDGPVDVVALPTDSETSTSPMPSVAMDRLARAESPPVKALPSVLEDVPRDVQAIGTLPTQTGYRSATRLSAPAAPAPAPPHQAVGPSLPSPSCSMKCINGLCYAAQWTPACPSSTECINGLCYAGGLPSSLKARSGADTP